MLISYYDKIPMLRDVSSGDLGLGVLSMTSYNGLRVTADSSYLSDIPPNPIIKTESPVARILFDGGNAIGVELTSGTQCWLLPTQSSKITQTTSTNTESQTLLRGKL